MMSDGMKENMRKVAVLGGVLTLVNFIAGFLAYPRLPEKVPTHWNFSGEVDGWGSAWQGAFMMPLLMAGILILMMVLPKIDPKRRNYDQMKKAYPAIVLVVMIFFTVLYLATLGTALGYIGGFTSLIQFGVGALFIFLGNYMGKLKHNYFMGIKTPWTLANEEVWYRTHRMAGPFWVAGGLLFMVSGFLPASYMSTVIIVAVFGLAAIPAGYSYVIYKRLEKEL
jgi:uncharacterized membrane protein